jgi:hypothetical protein
VITYEGPEPEENIFERDSEGNVTRIKLPQKLVIMANHQVCLVSTTLLALIIRIGSIKETRCTQIGYIYGAWHTSWMLMTKSLSS